MESTAFANFWVVIDKYRIPNVEHVKLTKQMAIESFCGHMIGGWAFWEKRGYACVQAYIRIELLDLIPIDNIL